ncbi:MAG TPA: NAD(P)/FAD-dependent oxidoreductase [Candidatus Cloacimonetes bacterium]|nr:NAD(P)/FAD-dependent oxidoreductase [Candidatus Cloacimonadota bacterium]HEX37518.1 NAD(P)/FAD-dependent oxidoreductase [Candidatus Cloacimonadota bacterium]
MKEFDVIVIGGGASGLAAAISSARRGAKTAILERLSRVGKKILVTGNGRCNFSNTSLKKKKYHGTDPAFIRYTFSQFGGGQIVEFFEELGILHKEEEDGRIFPRCDQAGAVLDVLRYECQRLEVVELCDREVSTLSKQDGKFEVHVQNGEKFVSDRVIVTAGGKSSPQFGSNGSGFALAQKLGHTVVEPFPTLVQIKLDDGFLNHLKGIKIEARVSLYASENLIDTQEGEILLTDYGISGIPALQLSRFVHHPELKGMHLTLHIDQFPELQFHDLKKLIIERFQKLHYKTIQDAMIGLVNKRMIPPILSFTKIDKKMICDELNSAQIDALIHQLKDRRFKINGTLSWRDAQATAGGVATKEIDERTLESKIVPGLYFAGEVIDIHGDSGGYNLAWAWASGYMAGLHAAGSIQSKKRRKK